MWRGVSEHIEITTLLDEIVANPAGDHRLARLAGDAAMSERNFLRVFSREIGVTPAEARRVLAA